MNSSIIADTGTTGHYLMSDGPSTDIQKAVTPISVCMPNGASIMSTRTTLL
jgi:hypothetical protein